MTSPMRTLLAGLCALFLYALPARAAEPLAVELETSAASLPEGDIRLAIEKELGRPVGGPRPGVPSDVTIGIADQRIVVRVRQSNAIVERSVPLPANLEDAPLTVSLIVGNLARDQSVGLAPATPPPSETKAEEREEPPSEPPPEEQPPAPSPSYRTHWFGIHAAQDFAIVGGNNVCDPSLGQMSANYSCFYSGTRDRPFMHAPYPYRDGVAQGLVVATTRVLAAYEAALSPWFSIGLRAGYAFRGGPPAGMTVEKGADGSVPDFAQGSGGTPFLPAHLELTLRGWFLPLSEKFVRAYVQGSAGMAQVDAKVVISEYDCTHAGVKTTVPSDAALQNIPWDPDDPDDPTNNNSLSPFEQCRQGKGVYDYKLYTPVPVDGWKKMGQGFVSLGAGSMVMVTERLGVVLNVNVMYMLPAPGIVIQPSLGMTVGL